MSTVAVMLLAGAANAADLGVVTQDPPAGYIASDWTGFYAGIFGGVGGGSSDLTLDIGGAALLFAGNTGGALGGIQLGADYQIGELVIGAVADIALTSISADNQFNVGGGGFGYQSRLNYLGTVRARFGFLPTENLLAYVHGGLAYGQTSPQISVGGAAGPVLDSVNRAGYTIGAGFEYKVSENISVQTEYAYTNLGTTAVSYTPVGGFPAGVNINEAVDFHTIKAGLNFRF